MYGKTDNELTKSKLYILFLLQKVGESVSEHVITQTFIETEIIEYFPLTQYLFELVQSKFIKKIQIEGKDFYLITERGKSAISFFNNRMLGQEKKKIESYLDQNFSDLKKSKEITAEYRKIKSGQTKVELKLLNEDEPYLSIAVDVPTIEMAKEICNGWKINATEIYSEVITSITKKRDEDQI